MSSGVCWEMGLAAPTIGHSLTPGCQVQAIWPNSRILCKICELVEKTIDWWIVRFEDCSEHEYLPEHIQILGTTLMPGSHVKTLYGTIGELVSNTDDWWIVRFEDGSEHKFLFVHIQILAASATGPAASALGPAASTAAEHMW